MYIIRTGTVLVLIEKEGKQIPIKKLGKVQYVGEMSFLTGVKRSATVIAEAAVLVNERPPDILEDEHLGLSTWAVSIARVLVRRIRTTTEQLGSYMTGPETSAITEPQAASEVSDGNAQQAEQARQLFLKGRFTEKSIVPIQNQSITALWLNGNGETGRAVQVCSNLIYGGIHWFLPSKDELNLMFLNLHQHGLGDFQAGFYWSSSEDDADHAWAQYFYDEGQLQLDNKNYTSYVRAIRAF